MKHVDEAQAQEAGRKLRAPFDQQTVDAASGKFRQDHRKLPLQDFRSPCIEIAVRRQLSSRLAKNERKGRTPFQAGQAAVEARIVG